MTPESQSLEDLVADQGPRPGSRPELTKMNSVNQAIADVINLRTPRPQALSVYSNLEVPENLQDLRPPLTHEEVWFRSKLPENLLNHWDNLRRKVTQRFPCRSEYLQIELHPQHLYFSLTDVLVILLSFAFLPMYFYYFDATFSVLVAFLVNRVVTPCAVLVGRLHPALRGHRISLFIMDAVTWYLCLGGLYGEVGTIIEMVNRPMFDSRAQAIEEDMWGCQPAVEFNKLVDIKIVGEYFHWCYFLFYLIMFLPLPIFYWRYPRVAYKMVALSVLSTLVVCSIIWVYFPVQGPYWTLPHRPAEEVGYAIPYLVQFLVEGGSSHGTAFPSSHCGVSTAAWIAVCWSSGGHFFIPFLLVTPGLWLSTIYGGFHYCIDSIIGIGLGSLLAVLAHYATPFWLNTFGSPTNRDDFYSHVSCMEAPSSGTPLSSRLSTVHQVYDGDSDARV